MHPRVIRRSSSFLLSKLAILAVASLLFSQCYSPSEYLNSDFIPDNERLFVKTDTSFVVSAHTLDYDTVNLIGFDEVVLGAINSNVFGKTKVSFMAQISSPGLKQDFGSDPVIDSVFLFFQLKDFYGNKSLPLTINVYELASAIEKDSLYNAFTPADDMLYPTPIGTVTYQGESFLKVPISLDWAEKLVAADSVTMATDSSFVKYIHGLYVTAEHLNEPGKAMYYFTYLNVENRLSLFYTKNEPDTSFQVRIDHQFFSTALRNIRIEHDKAAAVPNEAIVGLNDTIVQDSVFYLQGLAGTKGLLKLNDLTAWADSMPIVINKAELRIPLNNVPFFEPDSMQVPIMILQKEANGFSTIADMSSGNYGGTYIKSKGYYSFNITNHIQDLILHPSRSRNIYLEPRTRFSRGSQTILCSGVNSNRIKLIITYTKL